MGGKVVTLSDSEGSIYDKNGVDAEKLAWVMELKNVKRGRIREYAEKYKCEFRQKRPWDIPCQVAMPNATQNEVDATDAQNLVKNGCFCVSEGANMPSTPEAVDFFLKNKVLYGLGKAANAGGVATSGLEMSQNSQRLSWTREEVDKKLHQIMVSIHDVSYKTAEEYGAPGNYVVGANIAGFLKVASAMMAQGLV